MGEPRPPDSLATKTSKAGEGTTWRIDGIVIHYNPAQGGVSTPRPTDLLPGTLDMLVLKTFTRGHLHGYAIAQLIQQLSEDILQVEEGSLYPALQRLELNDGR